MRKRTRTSWKIFFLVCTIVLVKVLLVWYLSSPTSLAKVHGTFFGAPFRIDSILAKIDGKNVLLTPQQVFELNPNSTVEILELKTSRWKNYDLRLYSPDLDIAMLLEPGQKKSLEDILGEKSFQEPKTITLQVKEGVNVLDEFYLQASYNALDWAFRGDSEKNLEKKIFYYNKALEVDPKSQVFKDKLVQVYTQAGRFSELADFIEKNDNPTLADMEQLLSLYQKIGENEKAIILLQKLISKAKDQKKPTYSYQNILADIYKKQAKYTEAALIYEELLKEADDNQAIVFLNELLPIYRESRQKKEEIKVLRLLLEKGQKSQRAVYFDRLVELYEELGEDKELAALWDEFATFLTDDKEKAAAYKKKAFLLFKVEDYQNAINAYEESLKYDKDDPAVYLNLSRLFFKVGDEDNYLKSLEKSASLAPTAEKDMELAEFYDQKNMLDKAKNAWLKLKDQEPKNPAISVKLIEIFKKEGNTQGLIDEYTHLLSYKNDDHIAAYNLGVLYYKQKNWDQAIKYFKQSLALNDSDSDAIHAYLIGAYKEKGQTPEMIKEAMLLYSKNPKATDNRDLVVTLYRKEKQWKALLEAAQIWVKSDPTNLENWEILAEAQVEANQLENYDKTLTKIAQLSKNKVEPWLNLGQYLEKNGDMKAAKAAYQKILEFDSMNSSAEEAILRINLFELKK